MEEELFLRVRSESRGVGDHSSLTWEYGPQSGETVLKMWLPYFDISPYEAIKAVEELKALYAARVRSVAV